MEWRRVDEGKLITEERRSLGGRGKRCRRVRQEEKMDYVSLPLMASSVSVHIPQSRHTVHAQMQTFTYIHKHSQMLNSMIEAHSYRVDNWQIDLEHICGRINNK